MNNKNTNLTLKVNRNYKDSLFRLIFREPEELLELYNAINGTDYSNTEDLEVVTLENAIYMNIKNDIAFIVGCFLNLYEHQGSINPNMPMRYLQYVAKEYEKIIESKTLYSSKLVKIPAPQFIVFYNGTEEQPERIEMKLSDAYETSVGVPALELRVVQLNINAGQNKALMEKCKTLKEYSLYVAQVREYAETLPLSEAVERAVDECIKKDILKKFLTKYRAEAISMSIFEYDEEKEKALIRQAEREVGHEEGWRIGHAEGWQAGHAEGQQTGLKQGIQQGAQALIQDNLNTGATQEQILCKLQTFFHLTKEQALECLKEHCE